MILTLRSISRGFVGIALLGLAACGGDSVEAPTPPSIELLVPVGGETLFGVSEVRWRVENGDDELVAVLLSDTSGTTYTRTLVLDAPADQPYSWDTTTIPDGASYRIRVDLVSAGKVRLDSDASTADFIVDNVERIREDDP